MIAATDDDLVVGVCTHLMIVPPSPSPVPLPLPFIGMLSDPALQAALAMVQAMQRTSGAAPPEERPFSVNGKPMANQGRIAKNMTCLPHTPLPPAASFAPGPKPPKQPCGVMKTPPPPDPIPMPAGDAVLDKGSSHSVFGPGANVRLGDTAQCCSEPMRMSACVIAVPKGKPVLCKK